MYAIRAIYDGADFRLSEPISVQEEQGVVIVFIALLGETAKKQGNILRAFTNFLTKNNLHALIFGNVLN